MSGDSRIAKTLSFAAGVVSLAVLFADAVGACQICAPFPQTTLADILTESEGIVMVREDSERPYIFTPIEVLKGAIEGDQIKAFVDSISRRKLKQNPDDLAVLVRKSPEEDWSYRSYASIESQAFIRAIVEQSTQWNGLRGSDRRVAFFTDYLTDDNPLIREQAYLEVGRAPYSVIKTIAEEVPRDQFLALIAFVFDQFHMNDLIGWRRGDMNTGAHIRYQKELGDFGAVQLQR